MKAILALILCIVIIDLSAQWDLPNNGDAFLQDEIASIFITIDSDSLDLIFFEDSLFSNHEYPASFTYQSSGYSEIIENVGFRLRGNTSRLADKKSFKIAFNSFENEQRFLGLRKMNLNGEHNDPSIMRSKLNWDLLRELELPGSRTSYVKLYINEEYFGLYLNVEHIDKEFLNSRNQSDNGNLYKAFWGGDLNYISDDPDDYKFDFGWGRIYDLKTNEAIDDYSDLANFIGVLNNTPDSELTCELERVLNVDSWIKNIAVQVLIGHWDGCSLNKNNFYLYRNPEDQRFTFLEYDLDNTNGIDWFDINWSVRDIYDWSADGETRPIFERIMDVPEYRALYGFYIEQIISDYFNPEYYETKVSDIQNLIEDAVFEDEYRTLDYGFTFEDWENSSTEPWGGHVPFSILDYVQSRSESAISQLEPSDQSVVFSVYDNAVNVGQSLNLKFQANQTVSNANLIYSINGGELSTLQMFDDGLHDDLDALDNCWGTILGNEDQIEYIDYQIEVNLNGESSYFPCEFKRLWASFSNNDVVINEVMASNDSFISDEFDEYDDWVELYNSGTSDIFIGFGYLSNNISEPNKWKLPNVTLSAGDHILIWCDNDPEQGPLHTNFKIDADGDDILISGLTQGCFQAHDYITFDSMNTDESYGRDGDGNQDWIVFGTPTPDSMNGAVGVNEMTAHEWNIYPNPFQHQINFDSILSGEIFSLMGEKLVNFQHKKTLDLTELPAGVYLITTEKGTKRVVKL